MSFRSSVRAVLGVCLLLPLFASAQTSGARSRAVCEPGTMVAGALSAGAVRVQMLTGGEWRDQVKLTAPAPSPFVRFGAACLLEGDMLLVGEDSGGLPARPGIVSVFTRADTGWQLESQFAAPDSKPGDRFGYTLRARQNAVEIGSPRSTYTFKHRSGSWFHAATRPASVRAVSEIFAGAEAGISSIVLAATGVWTATSNAGFLHVVPESANGRDSALVVFRIDEFNGAGTRAGTLTVAGMTITVTQAGLDKAGLNQAGFNSVGETAAQVTEQADAAATDANGNVYFAAGDELKKWNAASGLTTGLVSIRPGNVTGIAADGSGNVYFADATPVGIRMWNAATQEVSTFSGTAGKTYAGIAAGDSADLYAIDVASNAIQMWSGETHLRSTLITGKEPLKAVTVDLAGNIYYSEGSFVKKRDAVTLQVSVLTTIDDPAWLSADGSGNLYIYSRLNNALWVRNAATGELSRREGLGVALAVDLQGRLFLSRAGGLPKTAPIPLKTGKSAVLDANTAQPKILSPLSLAAQTITFGPLPNRASGVGKILITPYASSSSGLAVNFSTTTGSVCTVADSLLTVVSEGTCSVTASLSGDGTYAAATPITQSFSVVSLASLTNPVIQVANGDVAGLITAINTVNFAGAGYIQLASGGAYSVTAPSDWWYGPNAFPAIQSRLYLDGNGATISRASGSQKFRFFYVSGGFSTINAGNLTLHNITLSGGLAQGGNGGAGNSGGGGGAGMGGAVYNQGNLILIDATLAQNTAQGGNGGSGNYNSPRADGGGGGIGGDGRSPQYYYITAYFGGYGGGFKGVGFLGSEAAAGHLSDSAGTSIFGGNGGSGGTSTTFPVVSFYSGGGGGGFQPGQNGLVSPGGCYPVPGLTDSYTNGGAGSVGGGYGGYGDCGLNDTPAAGGGAFGGGGGGSDIGAGGGGVGGGGAGGSGNSSSGGSGGFGGGGGGGTTRFADYTTPADISGFGGGNGGSGSGGNGGSGFGGAVFNHTGAVTLIRTSAPGNSSAAGSGGVFTQCFSVCNQTTSPNGLARAAILYDLNGSVLAQDLTLTSDFYFDVNGAGVVSDSQTPAASLTQNRVTTSSGIATNGSVNIQTTSAAELGPVSLTAFGSAIVGNSVPKTLILSNLGDAALTFTSISVTGDFAVQTCPSLPVYSSGQPNQNACSTGVTFTPSATGIRTGVLTVAGNFPGSPHAVVLSGFGLLPQTITFGALSDQPFNNLFLAASATASSGLPVSLASTTAGVCSVSGTTVTFVSVGTCTIQATQPGDGTYNRAPPVSQSFYISQGMQTIAFTPSTNSIAYTAGAFVVSATASSGLAVTFSSQDSSCTVSGSTVTITNQALNTSQCIIRASQPGNTNYSSATPVVQTFIIVLNQTLTLGILPGLSTIPNVAAGSSAFTVAASSSLGLLPVITSTTPATCTATSTTPPGNVQAQSSITPIAPGTCSLQATQAGTPSVYSATVTASFTVLQTQTINFGALPNQAFGSPSFTLTATASSNLAVTFSSNTPAICTVVGATVTILAGGSCTIQATQGGNGTYASTTTSRSLTITPATQTVMLGPISTQIFGTAPFAAPVAGASSGLPVTLSSTTLSVCTVSGTTITLIAPGTCTIQATQAGTANYATAATSQSFQVTVAAQTIAFSAPGPQAAGTAAFTAGVSASSGLTISLSSTTSGVCSVSGQSITALAPGICTVAATQAGNSAYGPANAVTQSFPVVAALTAPAFGNSAGSSSILLPVNGAWAATSNSSFLHILSGSASGTGSAVVAFTYDAFAGTGTRTGTLTLDGLTVTVTQVGTDYLPIRFPGNNILIEGGPWQAWNCAFDSAGNVYFTDLATYHAVLVWSVTTHQVTILPNTSTANGKPYGIAVDAVGNVYYSMNDAGTLLKWTAATQQVSTLISGLNAPTGVAADAAGNVYFAESGGNKVSKWNAATQQVTLVAGGLSSPQGVAVDLAGNVYIADINVVWKQSPATGQTTALISGLNNVLGVAVDGSGNVYLANYSGTAAVEKWSYVTQQLTVLAAPTPLPNSTNANPSGIAADLFGNVYYTEFGNGVLSNTLRALPDAFIGPATIGLTAPAGIGSFNVFPATESPGLSSIVSSDTMWLTVGTAASGVINFSFTANTGVSSRSATITALQRQVTMNQATLLSQTITFGALANQMLNTGLFTVTATSDSGLTVSSASTTSAICTVSGTTVILLSPGTCTIQATQAGNSTYSAAAPVSESFQVTQGTQTISFPKLLNANLGETYPALTAVASSGLPLGYDSTTPPVCMVSGPTVTLVSTGVCTIRATQGGNSSWTAATPVTRSFTTGSGTSITFTPVSNQTLGSLVPALSASASSGLPVAFTSTTPAICLVAGTSTTLLSSGTCTVQATQPGDATHVAAAPVSIRFGVAATPPSGVLKTAAGSPLTTGAAPTSIRVADFNGDGIPDIATANQAGDVTILLGIATGGFTASSITVAGGPDALETGDFNGDGKIDIAIGTQGSPNNLTILLGNGAGGFTAASVSTYALTGTVTTVAAGDFNNDGILDLVTSSQNGTSINVLLGTGAGGFTLASGSPFTAGFGPVVTVGDFDGDGNLDIAAATGQGNTVKVFLGDGTGGFNTLPGNNTFTVGQNPFSIATGDFNGDGYLDIATANQTNNNVSVLLGNGAGLFSAAPGSPFAAGTSPRALAAGDFDGDGKVDIVVSNQSANGVTLLLGNGYGGFAATTGSPFPTGTTPHSIAVGDFNGDGRLDVVTANQNGTSVTLLLGATTGPQTTAFPAPSNQTLGAAAFSIKANASSGLPLSFVSNYTAVCTVSAATVTLVSIGTCSITASQAGDANNAAATPVTRTFAVNGAPQTISFGPLTAHAIGSTLPALTATASSGLAVSFTSNSTGVCTISGTTIMLVAVGTCSITANQAGNASYAAASPVTQTFTVSAAVQTITFAALSAQALGSTPPALGATASSGLTVTYASNSTGVCTVTGTAITLVTTGTCSITASQAGNATFAAATPITQTFTVNLQLVAVPNVVGQTQATATATLTNSGLVVGTVTTASSSTVTAGNVISTNPTATTQVNVGSAVNLIVSTGPVAIPAPDLTGQFTVNRGALIFSRATGRYTQVISISNSGAAVSASAFVLDNLATGYALYQPTGVTAATAPAGSQFKETGPVNGGATITFTIELTRSGTPALAYTPRILGIGTR
jgi:hypothetical protein